MKNLHALVTSTMAILTCANVAYAHDTTPIRVATYNIAFDKVYLDGQKPSSGKGELKKALLTGEYPRAVGIANVIKAVNPDVLLLNEIDGNDDGVTVEAFIDTYLPDAGYQFVAPTCNTGVDSGFDYDNNGQTGDAGDAYGYGSYSGQYCMALLSKLPITSTQTFQKFLWKDLPNAHRPQNPDGTQWYDDAEWATFRLSSKTHADVTVDADGTPLHLLISHPTPPVFDGQEDRNGKRNFDEIRLFADYVSGKSAYLYDDNGNTSVKLAPNSAFVLLGDLNASMVEGDAFTDENGVKAMAQLFNLSNVQTGLREGETHLPTSKGGVENGKLDKDGKVITDEKAVSKYAAAHTAVWKMRVDYVLPSKNIEIVKTGVYWPKQGETGADWVKASDHRLVWVDVIVPHSEKEW